MTDGSVFIADVSLLMLSCSIPFVEIRTPAVAFLASTTFWWWMYNTRSTMTFTASAATSTRPCCWTKLRRRAKPYVSIPRAKLKLVVSYTAEYDSICIVKMGKDVSCTMPYVSIA